jgi:hypothetical protein
MTTGSRTFAASILRNHFDTEASDAGLRSLDLGSAGSSGSRSFDASAVARADRKREGGIDHQRVRETLKRLVPKHAELLSLAYGTRLRSRDVEDGKKRRAVPQNERNWRVRLVELYGPEGLIALASPLAQKLFAEHVQEMRLMVSTRDEQMTHWLLDAGKTHASQIEEEARKMLDEALDAFATTHAIMSKPVAPRRRSSAPTRAKILASCAENGQDIGA